MTCQEFEVRVETYVDGELGVEDALAALAHAVQCTQCQARAEQERRFRLLLRRQPREVASVALRRQIVAQGRWKQRRRRAGRLWIAAGELALAASVVLALVLPGVRAPASLVPQLIGAHIAYAQLTRPAELASEDRAQLEAWFLARARLHVVAPDYSSAGIRLIGGRIAELNERCIAYVLYEKGHTLLSVFIVPPGEGDGALTGTRVSYRGRQYITGEHHGYRTVSWADAGTVLELVSTLDDSTLLECADRLREERANQTRL
jgi:anti-sigma factor RsiW